MKLLFSLKLLWKCWCSIFLKINTFFLLSSIIRYEFSWVWRSLLGRLIGLGLLGLILMDCGFSLRLCKMNLELEWRSIAVMVKGFQPIWVVLQIKFTETILWIFEPKSKTHIVIFTSSLLPLNSFHKIDVYIYIHWFLKLGICHGYLIYFIKIDSDRG